MESWLNDPRELVIVRTPLVLAATTAPDDGVAGLLGPTGRRDFLRFGLGASATLLVLGELRPFRQSAQGGPLVFLATTALAAGVTWLVNTLLDKTFKLTENDVRRSNTTPTDNDFHNTHAAKNVIAPRTIGATQVQQNHWLSVVQFCRTDSVRPRSYKDWNETELATVMNLHKKGTLENVVYPCGEREEPDLTDEDAFVRKCRRSGVNPVKYNLDYVRPFNDGETPFVGYGVSSAAQPDDRGLLLVRGAA